MDKEYNINKTYDFYFYIKRILLAIILVTCLTIGIVLNQKEIKYIDTINLVLDICSFIALVCYSWALIKLQTIKKKMIWITTSEYSEHKVPIHNYARHYMYITLKHDGRTYTSKQHLKISSFLEKKEIKVGLYNNRAYVMR